MSEEQATKKQQRRKPFTQGWSESFHVTDSLPIKKGGKVIRTFIPTPTPTKGVQDDQDVVIHDDSDDEEKRLKKEEELENHRKASMRQVKPKLSLEIDINIQNTEAQKLALQQKIANICTLILANPEEAFSHRKKSKNAEDNEEDSDVDDDKEEEKRRKKVNKYENTPEFHIEDLLKLASSKNPYEVELVLLSTAVLFKDVCPSYRIRHVNTETDSSQSNQNNNKAGNPMKKETRQLIQFEKLLVKYYHDFIVLLQKRVEWSFTLQTPSLTTLSLALGIDNSDGDMLQTKEFSLSWKKYDKIRKYLGYIAFKAECELLKSLSSFNYRSLVLSSILQQSMTFYDYYYKYQQKSDKKVPKQQQVLQVTSLSITSFTSSFTGEMIQNIMNECIHCLEYLLLHDIDKDITLEILTIFHRNIKIVKYNISFHLLKIFESLSFHIHMNDKEKIQKMKKINKKQFKKQLQDIDREVEIGLLESNANGNEINKKAFEIQILQEVCLIYFRILKMKIGYHLIPIALEGLGRITHLIDMDTVKDLINLLRGFLFQQEDPNQSQLQQQGTLMNPHTPYEVKLLSLHCILKTLIAYSGKDVLQVDDEPYLLMFKLLLKKLPVPSSATTTIVNNEEGEAEEGVTEASSTNDKKTNKKEKGKERNHLSNHNEFSIYYYWKVILQIIDLLFIQKHDDRNDYVISIIKLLLKELSSQISRHVIPNSLGVSVMTFIHNLILRYPRIRSDLQDIIRQSVETIVSSNNNNNNDNNNDDEDGENNDNTTENKKKKKKRKAKDITPALFDEDEKVEDLAMVGLQEYDYHQQNSLLRYKGGNKEDGLGSGLSDLLRSTRDGRYSQIINHMLSKEFHPLPFRWSELEDGPGRKSEEKRDVTETGVNQVGQKRKRNQGNRSGGGGGGGGGGKKGGGGFKKKNDFVKQKKMRKQ